MRGSKALALAAPVSGAEPRFGLPTGTVTFLMTDVEGSTRRWEEAPEAMALAIPRHYVLMDDAIVRNGGVRPIEQGEGDSVLGSFSRTSDAVAAALAAQRALQTEAWPAGAELRVRMAIHTGEAELGAEGAYRGHPLNRGARLRAIGHGGQVLLSATSAMLAADRLPAGASLVDLGVHRLKDLVRAEHVWQLAHPDVQRTFPPLRSLETFRHNLPAPLTPLIGRSTEIAEVARLVATERVVTLTGSAGVGKTRLAATVGAELLDVFPGGVWWVELAPLSDGGAVGRAALSAIGAREAAGGAVGWQLGLELGEERSLLVLDNCEHLVTACAKLVSELLGVSSSVSILATSREPLGIPGEITWRVPSLGCPAPNQPTVASELSRYDAAVLFVERARRARPEFAVTERNAAAIAQICWRLDGIPLALELAAARCRQLSADRICIELDDRFRLLTGGARTLLARQQTLGASLDWSHDRLDDDEKLVFRMLGVFTGVFPLEAAEGLASAVGKVAPDRIIEVIGRLVDKSLVVTIDGPGGEAHYRMLESVRAYAAERARAAGELQQLRDAHANWWTAWIEPSFAMPTEPVLAEVERFHDDLAAALAWSTANPTVGLRLLSSLARDWVQLGRAADAIGSLDVLLSEESAERHPAAWLDAAQSCSAVVMACRGPAAWSDHLDRIEKVAIASGDDYHLAVARYQRGGEPEAQRVREIARERGDHYLAACATVFLALCVAEDDPVAADAQLVESASAAVTSGNAHLREQMIVVQSMAARCTGDLRRCIALGRAVLDSPRASRVLDILGPLSFAALLARDHAALRLAAARGEQEQRRAPGAVTWVEQVAHRLALLEGTRSRVHADLRARTSVMVPTFGTLWLDCREALDAGEPGVALEAVRRFTRPVPHGEAVTAAIEAAATEDERCWRRALVLAVDHNLRLIVVDALEGQALAFARRERSLDAVRVLGAAERLREQTGYQWRFKCEEDAIDSVTADAIREHGEHAVGHALAVGRAVEWRAMALELASGPP